jgi:peptide/nickel transport system permease protein
VRVVLQRAVRAVVLLFGVSLLSFALIEAAPGDFLSDLRVNPQVSPATVDALQREYGLDAPVSVRYGRWLRASLHGHLGFSLLYRTPVEQLVWRRALNTLTLTATSLACAWCLALAIGVASAALRGRADRWTGAGAAVLLALPDVLVALALLTVAAHTGWLSAGGMSSLDRQSGAWASVADIASHLAVPSAVLIVSTTPLLLQHVRQALNDALTPPLALALAARGVPRRRRIMRHALRLAAAPLAALGGLSMGALLSAGLVIEAIAGWPGLGSLLLEAVAARDEYVVVAITLLSALFLVAGNAVADAAAYAADPRAREAS